jgi:hypothetical protein
VLVIDRTTAQRARRGSPTALSSARIGPTGARHLVHERHLDEDERLVLEGRVEEREASGGRAPAGASGPGSPWISCTAS